MSDAEKQRIQERAAAVGLTVSDYIRLYLTHAEPQGITLGDVGGPCTTRRA
jgi:hypothetical protein